MWKLPSPSVICAQNSPMILTTGLTRSRSTSMVPELIVHGLQSIFVRIAIELLAHLQQRVDPDLPLRRPCVRLMRLDIHPGRSS